MQAEVMMTEALFKELPFNVLIIMVNIKVRQIEDAILVGEKMLQYLVQEMICKLEW